MSAAPLQTVAAESDASSDRPHTSALRSRRSIRTGSAAFEEQEANRIADRVIAANPAAGAFTDSLRPSPLAPPQRLPGLGAGRAPTPGERAWIEPRFGHSFGELRIHPTHLPRRAGMPLGWAYGAHVGVPPDVMSSASGRHILAHELAHVAQQAGREPRFQGYGPQDMPDPAYWAELVVASILPPYFPMTTAAVYDEAHPLWGYVKIWGEALAGDFVDDPSFAAIFIRTLLTLIPYVDTAADVEDMAAAFYQLVYLQRYDEVMPWLSLVISLVGFFPELGSVLEGVVRGILLKGGGYALAIAAPLFELLARHLDELAPFVHAEGRRIFDEAWKQAVRIRAAVAAFDPGAAASAMFGDLGTHVDDVLRRIDNEVLAPLQAVRQQLAERIDGAMLQLREAVTPQHAAVTPLLGDARKAPPLGSARTVEREMTEDEAIVERLVGAPDPESEVFEQTALVRRDNPPAPEAVSARPSPAPAPEPAIPETLSSGAEPPLVSTKEITEVDREVEELLGGASRDALEHPEGTALVRYEGGRAPAVATGTPSQAPAAAAVAADVPVEAAATAPAVAAPLKRSASRSAKQREADRLAEAAKPMAERTAETEAALAATSRRVVEYKKSRVAAGKTPKGGPMKKLWNLYERKWVLERKIAYPDRQLLEQATVVGVRLPDGTLRPTRSIAPKGRIFDFLELDAGRAVGGDLKSEAELMGSVAGGIKNPDDIALEWRGTSKIGEQHEVESQVRELAEAQSGKIVVNGFDVETGRTVSVEIDPADLTSVVWHYQEVFEN